MLLLTEERLHSMVVVSLTIRSYEPERLQNVFRKERKDGSGDVIIAHKEWRDSDGDKQREELGFIRIKDAKKVELILKNLAEQGSGGNG